MPKSKRDKKVSLTKTSKHGMEWKKKLVSDVREAAEKYESIYIFQVIGMRGAGLRQLRRAWKEARIFLGKNKVMALALGKTTEAEVKPGLHKLSSRLSGDCGLLFTNKDEEEVVTFFNSFVEKDFARGGTVASRTVDLEEGPLVQFSHAIEPHLRSLGLPTALKKGVVTMIKDYNVCKQGQTLNPEQAKILKLLDIQMAEFRLILESSWSQPDCIKVYSSTTDGTPEPEDMEDEENLEINEDEDEDDDIETESD